MPVGFALFWGNSISGLNLSEGELSRDIINTQQASRTGCLLCDLFIL
jgi:hypothetical protein